MATAGHETGSNRHQMSPVQCPDARRRPGRRSCGTPSPPSTWPAWASRRAWRRQRLRFSSSRRRVCRRGGGVAMEVAGGRPRWMPVGCDRCSPALPAFLSCRRRRPRRLRRRWRWRAPSRRRRQPLMRGRQPSARALPTPGMRMAPSRCPAHPTFIFSLVCLVPAFRTASHPCCLSQFLLYNTAPCLLHSDCRARLHPPTTLSPVYPCPHIHSATLYHPLSPWQLAVADGSQVLGGAGCAAAGRRTGGAACGALAAVTWLRAARFTARCSHVPNQQGLAGALLRGRVGLLSRPQHVAGPRAAAEGCRTPAHTDGGNRQASEPCLRWPQMRAFNCGAPLALQACPSAARIVLTLVKARQQAGKLPVLAPVQSLLQSWLPAAPARCGSADRCRYIATRACAPLSSPLGPAAAPRRRWSVALPRRLPRPQSTDCSTLVRPPSLPLLQAQAKPRHARAARLAPAAAAAAGARSSARACARTAARRAAAMVWEHPVSLVAVYAGFYLAIVFVSLSIACGLYYLGELCEEYVLTTRRLIGHAIKVGRAPRPAWAGAAAGPPRAAGRQQLQRSRLPPGRVLAGSHGGTEPQRGGPRHPAPCWRQPAVPSPGLAHCRCPRAGGAAAARAAAVRPPAGGVPGGGRGGAPVVPPPAQALPLCQPHLGRGADLDRPARAVGGPLAAPLLEVVLHE